MCQNLRKFAVALQTFPSMTFSFLFRSENMIRPCYFRFCFTLYSFSFLEKFVRKTQITIHFCKHKSSEFSIHCKWKLVLTEFQSFHCFINITGRFCVFFFLFNFQKNTFKSIEIAVLIYYSLAKLIIISFALNWFVVLCFEQLNAIAYMQYLYVDITVACAI